MSIADCMRNAALPTRNHNKTKLGDMALIVSVHFGSCAPQVPPHAKFGLQQRAAGGVALRQHLHGMV